MPSVQMMVPCFFYEKVANASEHQGPLSTTAAVVRGVTAFAAVASGRGNDLSHVELDLPEAPEKAAKPPLQAVDPYSRFAPKPEISHISRAPEKRPPRELSLAFLALTLLPFVGFLVGMHVALNVYHCRGNLIYALYV